MDCLREFLPEQNICPIKEAIAGLEEEFDYDVSKVNHIQLALLKFQVHNIMSNNRHYHISNIYSE